MSDNVNFCTLPLMSVRLYFCTLVLLALSPCLCLFARARLGCGVMFSPRSRARPSSSPVMPMRAREHGPAVDGREWCTDPFEELVPFRQA